MADLPDKNLLKQYEEMINAFDDAVFILEKSNDGDYRFQALNKLTAITIGLPEKEIQGKTLKEIFLANTAEKLKRNYDRCLNENQVIEYEEELFLSNRRSFWKTRLSPFLNYGQVIGVLGLSKNITGQKNIQDVLSKSENKYRAYVENSPLGVFVANHEGYYLEVNPMASQITGYSKEELLKMNLRELVPQEHFERGIAHFERLKKDGKACSDVKYLHKDGTIRWWTINAVKLNETSFLGFVQDITSEKENQQSLSEKEQLFQAMLNAIPDMVSVQDPQMNIIYSNWNGFAAVEPAKRLLNTKCYRTYRGYDDLCPDCQAKNVMLSKRNHQAQARLPDGTWVEIRVIPIFDRQDESDGEKNVKYFLEWVRDITDFKQKEEELQEQKEELAASNEELEGLNEEMKALNEELIDSEEKANKLSQAKSEFLANMSHELRTPLNGILGFSKLLQQTEIDDTQADYLNCVVYSGELLLNIINDILDFSKIEAGKLILEETGTDIKILLQNAFKMSTCKANQKPLNYRINIDENIPDQLLTDPLRLNQVLTNLLGNAVKFTEKGTISLQAQLINQTNTHVRIHFSVQDTGIGIPEDQKEHIFEMFTQVDSSNTRLYGGTGLGLPISAKILEKMGSKIHLITTPGKGSTFSFVCDFKLPSA
ncbi:MAG TPA: PAS domain S-box protein [Thermotogota bacterium]|nr:PAS domain S-box protein [Thermotogota bacterium]HRW35083.1 PAS domain S-box protein [Thermotogota bacterium]